LNPDSLPSEPVIFTHTHTQICIVVLLLNPHKCDHQYVSFSICSIHSKLLYPHRYIENIFIPFNCYGVFHSKAMSNLMFIYPLTKEHLSCCGLFPCFMISHAAKSTLVLSSLAVWECGRESLDSRGVSL
jgi:hypothetical protein